MSGMMRFKNEKDFQDMLKRSRLKVVGDTAKKAVPVVATPSRIVAAPAPASDIEELFAQQLSLAQLPPPVRQYLYLRGSKHTLDFAWPDLMIGVEVQGMVHRIKTKFHADIKKRATAMLQGWKVLEVGGDEIRAGIAVQWLHELFKMKKGG